MFAKPDQQVNLAITTPSSPEGGIPKHPFQLSKGARRRRASENGRPFHYNSMLRTLEERRRAIYLCLAVSKTQRNRTFVQSGI
jgi:hypothetical protein